MTFEDRSLGELVNTHPALAKVFQKYRLDYCCGGRQSLAEACAAENLDLDEVLRGVEAAQQIEKTDMQWNLRPLDELIQHILNHYHARLRTELPMLVELAAQVERVHADKPDCPAGLTDLMTDVRAAVESHLAKEEQILFPLILAGRSQTAYMPVQVMMQEHMDHGKNLRRIRELTGDLTVPENACASWRALYHRLGALEEELMEHIHLENNNLFPRALAE